MQINPFDLLSGKVVQNEHGTFWFKEAGINIEPNGKTIPENLHREDDLPAMMLNNGTKKWFCNGKLHRINGPAVLWNTGEEEWYIDDVWFTEEDFNKYVRDKPI